MYKHILLPTDGSALSEAAVLAGVALAQEQQAKVTGLYVMPEYQRDLYVVDYFITTGVEEFYKNTNNFADDALFFVEKTAQHYGVRYELARSINASPYKAIIKHAKSEGCDLIYMASHGRKGFSALLLGSETQRVLAHTDIPVLVHRT